MNSSVPTFPSALTSPILLFLFVACGHTAHPAATPRPVGAACTTDADCLSGLFCETRIPGGICTRACDDFVCPDGSHCINVVVVVVNQSAYRCLQDCSATQPCRTDGSWQCKQPEGVDYSVCAPA